MGDRILDDWIKARVTSEFKEVILDFCREQNMSISELIRAALIRYMGGVNNGNGSESKDN